jgi:hypothetical protein
VADAQIAYLLAEGGIVRIALAKRCKTGVSSGPMTYVKGCLGGLAALFLSGYVLLFITAFRDASQNKATGLAVFVILLIESVRSPLFWLLAIMFFAMFYATGRLTSSVFRVLLFWLPAIGATSLGLGLLGWFAMLMLQMKRS